MKNIAIVNLMDISSYFYKNIDGETQLGRITQYAKSLPQVEEIHFLLREDIKEISNKTVNEEWNEEQFMRVLGEKSKGFDHLFYFFGDCPVLDTRLSHEMFDEHINFYAEYTFADGYPYGLTPEIIDVNIVPALNVLSKDSKEKIGRDTIFNIVKKDINSFELETKIADTDLRLLRISLTTDNRRNYHQLLRIIKLGGIDAASISQVLISNAEILIQEPSYITIEVTKKNIQNVTYLPKRIEISEFMNLKTLDIILKKIKDYSDDATISFTPEYEPTTHPELLKIIKMITVKYNFDLYIETSGLGWSKELIEEVEINNKIKLIILLDAIDPELYIELRGGGQQEAISFTNKVILLASDRVWVQATRMKTNEKDMEPFYRYWQEHTDKIIIQKYSNYNNSLPDLKVADLSPLKRFPCWHLKKDLHINTEGEALLCFNDINGTTKLGSLITEDIKTVMNNKKEHYLKQIKCEYTDFCRNCDEYYTFNF